MKLQFGKYKGWNIEDLPSSYIFYLITECDWINVSLRSVLESELSDRLPALKINSANIKNAFRQMAMKYHPDKGGSTQQMQAIIDFYEHICQ